MKLQKNMTLRWITLISIFINVIFNNIYSLITNSATVAEVTNNYPVYLTPAGYTFSIWGIIFFAFIVYGIVQVMPAQRDHSIYDTLCAPVILINIFCSAWIIFYTQNRIGVSVLILALALTVSFRAFRKAYLAVQYRDYNLWLQFPFSLISGWLTVALAANLRIYLEYMGITPGIGDGDFTILMIILLTVVAFAISIRTHSLVYPAAIAWALTGISVARQHETAQLSTIALSAAILLFAGSFLAAVFRKTKVRKHIHQHRE